MSFVAQPYEQFVDDLLTALTGGMVREEHQFLATGETYSLASPGAVQESIRLFGQQNETFRLFQRDIDYSYDVQEELIYWLPAGNSPDERSYFYVNYYLREARRRLTDRNPGSVTTILSEAFARELAVLHKQMEFIYRSAYVDLAAGASLDHVAALLGLARKDAKFASGEVLFKRATPAPGDITIPFGTLISTVQGQNFETSNKRTLRRGQLAITVPIRAQVEGPSGRVEAKAIVNINRPIFGIESVISEEATFFATEKETDEEFRGRIKGTLERAGKASFNAIKYGLIEEVAEINENNIQLIERSDEPGLVEVRLGLEAGENPDIVRRVEEAIFNSRAAGIRVKHNLLSRTPQMQPPVSQQPRPEAPLGQRKTVQRFPPETLDQFKDEMLPLRIEVLLRLTDPHTSAAQKERIEDEVRSRVADYIETLPMGADLIYNKLLGRIVQSEDLRDIELSMGATGDESWIQGNLSTSGRKAQVNAEDIFVSLMEEAVFIDVLVQIERVPEGAGSNVRESPKSSVEVAIEEGRPKSRIEVTRELYLSVENTINRILASVNDSLVKTELRSAIKSELQAFDPELQFIEKNGLVINAEYEATGRLLKNTETVSVEINQMSQLRELSIKTPGVLDV